MRPDALTPGRRLAGLALLVAALVLVGVVVVRAVHTSPDDRGYRVDAIFDVARGIAPKQVVKVAGAQVGTVVGVRLTPGYKARVQMRIDRRFAPFRADASCAIRPEGLISENFVDCRPGSPAAAVLPAQDGVPPTVPIGRTSAPVSLQDLLDIWRAPTADRAAILVDELGLGLAGRGADLNAILYRANPTLAAARRAIDVVNGQRRQLQHLFTAAAPVLTQLAHRDADVQRFITRTADLTDVTAAHRDGLRLAIRRLPPLLQAAGPALRQLDATASSATPLLRELQGAAPALDRLGRDLPPLASTAAATLTALERPLRRTRTALVRARPVTARLARFAAAADPAGRGLARLLVSLRDSGAIENVLHGAYALAGLTNRYDATSHVLLGLILFNQCVVYAKTPTAGCSARMDGTRPGATPARRTGTAATGADRPAPRPTSTTPASAPAAPSPAATPAPATAKPVVPGLPPVPTSALPTPVRDVLDYLLG